MDTIAVMRNYKELVDKELKLFFDKKIEETKNIDPSSVEALELLKDYTLRGGKRIRAAMLYYGYACFKEPNNELIKTSMAMELVQSYLLIHDDIIDNDDLRRGKDTVHVSYKKLYTEKNIGKSLAILLGDIACCLANEILAESNFNDELKNKAINEMNKVIRKVNYGQILDVLGEIKDFNEGDVLFLYKLKSATYTIEGPLHIGATLAGANEEDLRQLSRYAIPLGLAFQIRDDINGTFGDEKKTGKSSDSDIKQGKRTLMMLKAMNEDEETRNYIVSKLEKKKSISKEDISIIKKILIEKGSLDYCKELADKYVHEAIGFIKNTDFTEEGKDFLINIADYIANRDH